MSENPKPESSSQELNRNPVVEFARWLRENADKFTFWELWILLRSLPVKMLVKIISFIVGTLSTVAVSSFFLYPHFYPIPHSTTPADKRAEVIRRYYDRLNGKRYEDAWAQIHPKRKKEIEDTIPTWQEFAKRYASTVEHENIKVDLETDSDSEAIYQVSFDVRDACLRSTFYQWREKFVEDLYDSNVMNKDAVMKAVRKDLDTYFIVPAGQDDKIEKAISLTKVSSLFGPLLIQETGASLKFEARHPAYSQPLTDNVWRHFILRLRLRMDDSEWKIMGGLREPVVADYGPAGIVISKSK